MRLKDAMLLARQANAGAAPPVKVHFASGFTAMHATTFTLAYLAQRFPGKAFSVSHGPYGDLPGSLSAARGADVALLTVEYADLDPRLGLRRLSGWSRGAIEDTVAVVRERLGFLAGIIASFECPRIAIMPATLRLPPMFSVGAWQASPIELLLRQAMSDFLVRVSAASNVVVCDVDDLASTGVRRDPAMEFVADFPFSVEHASAVVDALVKTAFPPAPLKGLITDLDDTLWRGLVGEVGPENVHWSLDHNSHLHVVYQQFLNSLAEQGALLAIASKNEASVVAKALERKDLQVSPKSIFPIEAHWGPKSQSVERILKTWNIFEDSVAFVDDNPLELAEVAARFPKIQTYLFPKTSDAQTFALIRELRGKFHKESVSAEDAIRLDSIRNAEKMEDEARQSSSPESFLQGLDAAIELDFDDRAGSKRAFELVNKTNQFNLNGRRVDESEWKRRQSETGSFICVASYTDKFGPLGKIGVMFGYAEDDTCRIDGWVLSCRAFSRRVEHAMLKTVITKFNAKSVVFDFKETEKNKPTSEFLTSVDIGAEPQVGSGTLLDRMPQIYSTVSIV